MADIQVKAYEASYKNEWDELINRSKNSTFMLKRDYIDYHKDRFVDHSIMLYKEDKLIAVFPANEKESVIQSHGGLSYGGLIYTTSTRISEVLKMLDIIVQYYANNGFKELIYKAIPLIYCTYPSSEIEYALFLKGAELFRRDISSTIPIAFPKKKSKGRRALLAKGKQMNFKIFENDNFELFFEKYNFYLEDKYSVKAVHSSDEMKKLQECFPENIKYYQMSDEQGTFLGGTILYCTEKVIHAQYIHFSDEAKKIGAFDVLMEKLLNIFSDRDFFDFGISTENDGKFLNEGLISFKESFGARGTLCDFYKINLTA